jgi:AraC-like DNA-binding protein
MPIYMDRHESPGLTEVEAAEGHKEDMKVQHKYGCKAFTYWFDAEKGNGFCLIDAPNKEAVIKMHDEAHGGVPNQIIEVNLNIVEAFLGRIKDPDAHDEAELLSLIDPAFRIIMATVIKNAALIKSKFGNIKGTKILNTHNGIIEKAIDHYKGREVEYTGNAIMASFISASKSVECALDIQKHFRGQNNQTDCVKMDVTIGLSAGNPVTDKNEFFGDAIPFAKRLSYIGGACQVLMSSSVREQLKRERLETLPGQEGIKALNPQEENLINQLMDVMVKAWNQEGFNVKDLGKQMALSKAQLYRKVTALTNLCPTDFIRDFRLNKAIELMEKQHGNISEIAFETGFASSSYFSKCFQQRFCILPSDYIRTIV